MVLRRILQPRSNSCKSDDMYSISEDIDAKATRNDIEAAGYEVVNLTYWRFTLDQKAQKHEKVIKTYLQKAGVLLQKQSV